jgi:ankyrin repeat protein
VPNVKLLLAAAPSSLDLQNQAGYTALMKAVIAGHIDIVTFLLENHADKHIENQHGATALHLAQESYHSNKNIIIKLLTDC